MNAACVYADRELSILVPAALQGVISCHVLSDDHPFDKKLFDVVVCTSNGEVLELWRRQVTSSLLIAEDPGFKEISIYRNCHNIRFYLVSTSQSLYIISTEDHLTIYKTFDNVDKHVLDDPYCTGTAHLRLWCNEDAIPIVLDDNFEIKCEYEKEDDKVPEECAFVTSLKAKLTEARHTVAVNKTRHDRLLKFRQEAMHTILQDMCPNESNDKFKICERVHAALTTDQRKPWLRLCNGRAVIGVKLFNKTSSEITNIKFILQSNTASAVTYETFVYTPMTLPPFWQHNKSKSIEPQSSCTIVAVTDIHEFSHENTVQYLGLIVYDLEGKEKFIPLEEIKLSCLETLNESFDVLSSKCSDEISLLAMLATTVSLKVKVRHLSVVSKELPDLSSIFQQHMQMEPIGNTEQMLVHRTSPYHVLNGVILVIDENDSSLPDQSVTIFLRNKSQLPSLLHLIYDGVPYRLMITSPNIIVKDKRKADLLKDTHSDENSMDLDVVAPNNDTEENFVELRKSLSNQMSMVLDYMDECMKSMAESGNAGNLIGTQIDFVAPGESRYLEFTQALNEEIKRGFSFLNV